VHSQQPNEAACDSAESDTRLAYCELPGDLTGLDVSKGARCQATGGIEQVQASPSDESTDVGMRAAEPGRYP
jgi:hypothetical protein